MVDCDKCGKKIGFFEQKYSYEDKKGNDVKYCSECNRKFEEKAKIKKDREEKIKKVEREGLSLKEIKSKLGNDILDNFEGEEFLNEEPELCSLCHKWESVNQKIGNFKYCKKCFHSVKKSYSDLIFDIYSKLYYDYIRIKNLKEFESSGTPNKYDNCPLNYQDDKGFLKKISIKEENEDIIIKFLDYKVNYDMDRRLLHEN